MQLKKINQDHYVVVTDEPIKEDCYALHISPLGEEEVVTANGECKLDKKITHSTKPIEETDRTFMSVTFGWNKIKKLNLSYIKSLVGEVDVEKKSQMACFDYAQSFDEADILDFNNGYLKGYNQCIKDNKDKRFSEEDMLIIRNKLVNILPIGDVSAWDMIQAISKYTKWFDEYVESLTQPKDTWEVYFDSDNNLKLK